MKVVKSASHYTETALDEIKLCDRICVAQMNHTGWNHAALLYDNFFHRGPHGRRAFLSLLDPVFFFFFFPHDNVLFSFALAIRW